jgi:formate dehydrogenase subunit delta
MSASEVDHLVKMANQIALNIGAQQDVKALSAQTGDHISRFWTKAMQEQLHKYWQAGGEGLEPAVVLMLKNAGASS